MKKLALFSLASCMMLNAHAQENLCGYQDYFHLDDKSHPAIFILSANSNSDIYLQVIGPRSFELKDTERCRDGYAHVTVAYDAYNWCVLDIKDGPFMMHPTISASCHGMRYRGLSYDGFGTYSYTIRLD